VRDSRFTFRQDDAGRWREVHELPLFCSKGPEYVRPLRPRDRESKKSARAKELWRVFGFGSLALSGFLLLQLGGHDTRLVRESLVNRNHPGVIETQTAGIRLPVDGPWVMLPVEGAAPSGSGASPDALTLPSLSMLMYEAGVFDNVNNAAAAAADYRQSGVLARLSAAGPRTILLLGPTISARGNESFQRMLERAQVPYFLRPFSVASRVLTDANWSLADYLYLSRLVTRDVQYLQAAIARQSGFRVLTPMAGRHPSGEEGLAWPVSVGDRPGTLGARLENFNRTVQALPEVNWEEGKGGEGSSVRTEMSDLCRAVVAYQDIAPHM